MTARGAGGTVRAMRPHRLVTAAVAVGALMAPRAVPAQPRAPHAGVATAAPHAGVATAPHAGVATAPLRFTYVAGHKARYVTTTVQTLPNQGGRSVTSATIEVETAAVHPDGSAGQRMRVVRMDITGAGVPAAARDQIVRGMTGVTMEYTQDSRGRITERHAPTGVSDDMRPFVDGVVQTLDQLSPQLPEAPVAVGSTWHDHRTVHLAPGGAANLDMDQDVTYTLREIRPAPGGGRSVVVGVAMTFATGSGANIAGVPLRGNGQATGDMTLDLGHGALSSSRSTGAMTLHMTVQGRNLDVESRFENDLQTEALPH